MPAAPTEDLRAARNPQDSMVAAAHAEFDVAATTAETIDTSSAAPMEQGSLAERAVQTVVNLAETQFAASMQRSGSVQLRLKFGGDDLSVRIAIRDGAIAADFRTDSAPLRAALEREWHAVAAASPEHLLRFAEPVFAPASVNSSSPFGSSADSRPSASQHQAQPDAQQHRAPRDLFDGPSPFARRSLVGESFVPETPAPRVAAFLPTSLRLSALA